MRAAFLLKDRSDQELLEGAWAALTRECEDVAVVIAHLAEIDKRKLFPEEGCGSLKSYCMEVLHLSEDQAYSRIAVARLAQKFPVILEILADGLVHLTAVHRLGPSLTQENHLAVLEEATCKSMAKVEEMVARLRPQPPVPSRIRKLNGVGQKPGESGLFVSDESSAGGPDRDVQEEYVGQSRHRRSAVSPLAPDLYDVHFTADKETVDALKLLQELLSHQVPSCDPAIIIKDSLLIRLQLVQRQRFGKGKRQRRGSPTAGGAGSAPSTEGASVDDAAGKETAGDTLSRHIPSEVKQAVWERDQGRCAFVAQNGRWCSERRWIEFHHIIPFAWRGESTVENIELRCRTHNAYEGELIFGKVIRKSKAWALPATTRFKTSKAGTAPSAEAGAGAEAN
jgi:hypothetical protein